MIFQIIWITEYTNVRSKFSNFKIQNDGTVWMDCDGKRKKQSYYFNTQFLGILVGAFVNLRLLLKPVLTK